MTEHNGDYPPPLTAVNQMEPAPRRVRAMLGGRIVVDEKHELKDRRGQARRFGLRLGDPYKGRTTDYWSVRTPGRIPFRCRPCRRSRARSVSTTRKSTSTSTATNYSARSPRSRTVSNSDRLWKGVCLPG